MTKSNDVIASELKHMRGDLRELCSDVKDLRASVEKINSRFTLFFGLGIGAMAASGMIKEGAEGVLKSLIGVIF